MKWHQGLGVWVLGIGLLGCSTEARLLPEGGPGISAAQAEQISLDILREEFRPAGDGISIEDLRVSDVQIDARGMAHTRVRQSFQNVAVFGAETIVHLRSDGSLFAITPGLVKQIDLLYPGAPSLSGADALNTVLSKYDCVDCFTAPPQIDTWIVRRAQLDRMAYRVRLYREDGTQKTSMPVYFVDAHDGQVFWQYDNLQTATGLSLYSGQVSFGTYSIGQKYYLEDLALGIGTFDSRGVQYATHRFWDDNDIWDAPDQRAAVDVHFCASKFMDYFSSLHGRDGIDGMGGPGFYSGADKATPVITSRVHYGEAFANAYWNGAFMTYGDGDGATFGELVSMDICGHEMQHGITERTANLTYSDEPGALNESWSDVFGALLERYVHGESADTWRVGETCYTPGNGTSDGGIRDMADPHSVPGYGLTPDDDPDHYSERYTGQEDNGGVHINSGIANKAFYLLAAGGSHHMGGSMNGIGADQAGAIWYLALTQFMVPSTDFAAARAATLNAAQALYGPGSAEEAAVAQAWSLVGVN